MTEPTPADPAVEPEAEPEQDAPPAETESPNHEAARYRTQLRAAEGERDALRATVAAMQGEHVARQASARLVDGSDLLDNGATLPDLLDEAGNVDPDKLTDALDALLVRKPHLGRVIDGRRSTADPAVGAGPPPAPDGPGWGDVISGRAR